MSNKTNCEIFFQKKMNNKKKEEAKNTNDLMEKDVRFPTGSFYFPLVVTD